MYFLFSGTVVFIRVVNIQIVCDVAPPLAV